MTSFDRHFLPDASMIVLDDVSAIESKGIDFRRHEEYGSRFGGFRAGDLRRIARSTLPMGGLNRWKHGEMAPLLTGY